MESEISSENKIKKNNLQDAKNNNRRLWLFMTGAFAVFGIVEGARVWLLPPGDPDSESILLTFAKMLACNVIIFYWFANDTRIVNYPASGFLKFSVVFFAILAISYYLFRSRRFPGCLKSFGWALLLCIVSLISFGAALGIIVLVPFLHL